MTDLRAIALQLATPGKGILAVDDFLPGIAKRLAAVGVASTPETRRGYREMLFSTSEYADLVSGTIMFEETFWNAKPPPSLRGVKLDIGQRPLALADGETITQGLDGLEERVVGFKAAGASFGKWRAVLKITKDLPSLNSIRSNAHALARYAAMCQAGGLVPVVEPDILMDGSHNIERCAEVTEAVLDETFEQLEVAGVDRSVIVLKPNMVTAGSSAPKAAHEKVAEMTVKVLKGKTVGGIAFLSGGQSEIEATQHLNFIAKELSVTFSFNRALQDTALKIWAGKQENVPKAQAVFAHRLKMNALASKGQWSPELEAQ